MSVFLGWMPDAAAQAALATLQQRIRAALPADAPRHDWRTPAQWHITLRYLGDAIDDTQRARIHAAMDAFASQSHAADASLVGAQYWPHARVLVAKVDASDALKGLLTQLETSMQACGFARERAQTAHVTLAYLPRDAQAPAVAGVALPAAPLRIDRVQLLRSVPGGYMSLASWLLAHASNDA